MNISSTSIFSKINELTRQNNDALAIVLDRIKSSSNGSIPRSTDFTGIKQAVSFQFTTDAYQAIYDQLSNAKNATSLAVEAGRIAYGALSEMQRLAKLYPDLSLQADQQAADVEFRTQAGVVENLKTSAQYNGIMVFRSGTVLSVSINPSSSGKLEVVFDAADIPDVSGFNLYDSGSGAKDLAAVNAELNKIHSYIGKAYSYDSQVVGYLEIAGAIINASIAGRASFTDTMAQDLASVTEIQVRQQNIAAMVSQANMNKFSAAKIFEMNRF